jgi:type I restriction enzyme M protein
MVIRGAFKQTKGLFLTHPNIVLFILATLEVENLVNEKLRNPDEDIRYRLPFIIDPSCGTGTFLVHYMKYVQKHIDENHNTISAGDDDIMDFIERQMTEDNAYKWVINYVYGIDNEQVLASACQINMILHGDGSTNIYGTDGLDSFENYSKLEITGANNILSSKVKTNRMYYSKSTIDRFNIVVSNPPFNVNINNKTSVQQNFEISGKSEAYFLERWYQLLKPNGRIGVVLPESFFSVEDDINGRLFLYKHFNIKSIVSLPNHAFSPHTTTSTSLLFASKKTQKEEEQFQET